MFDRIFANPKSSICGLIISITQAVMMQPGTGVDWKAIGLSIPTLLLGLLVKDK